MSDDLNLVNISSLRQCLGLTWYLLRKCERLGLLGKPDAFVGGRPHWRLDRVEEIERRINQYDIQISNAKYSPNL